MRIPYSFTAVALAVLASPAASAERVTWKWEKDSLCSLTQKLESSVTWVTVTRSPGSDMTTFTWLVRSPSFSTGYYPDAATTLSNGSSAKSRVRVYSAENRRYRLNVDTYGRSLIESAGGVTSVAVEGPKMGRFEAPVRDLAAALDALKACEDKFLAGWGIDLNSYWALASRPQPTVNLGELFNFTDYPGVGMTKLIESRVIAKLMVGSDGRVTECSSPGHHDYGEFVEVICTRLREKARFTPAIGTDGQPIDAPYVTYAQFSLADY